MKEFQINSGMRNVDVRIPDENFLYCARTPRYTPEGTEQEMLARALEAPIGSRPLDRAIPKDAKVVIVVDDATRPTPCARILPQVLREVEKCTHSIKILTAPGTHRMMTQQELQDKIGQEVLEKYPVVNLDYRDESAYQYVETTAAGTPLYIHKDVLDADFKITIGNIVPHVVVGWSGGAKTIQPGVSGRLTTDHTHWIGAVKDDVMHVCGNLDCMCRAEIDHIGGVIGLDFIINTVMDEDKRVLRFFCGNYILAHREGVRFAEKILRPEIPEKADILIASANPAFVDYWQGFKPMAFAQYGVKEGGVIIFLLDAPEGLCGNAPSHKETAEKYFTSSVEEIIQKGMAGEIEDRVGATNPLNHLKIIDHAEVICVSKGLSDREMELLRFQRADSMEEAIEKAFEKKGKDAKVGIIPYCGEMLVRVAGQ